MSSDNFLSERRKYNRFQAQDGAFATLTSGTETRLGLICDISRSGLALRYVADSSDTKNAANIPATLDIIFDAEGYYLENIPCTMIWERQLPAETSFSDLAVNKCSVRFDHLTADQQEQLLFFIDNFAKPVAPIMP
jgi:hypothetical protein